MIDLKALAADLSTLDGVTINGITDTVIFAELPSDEDDSPCFLEIFDDGDLGLEGRWEYIDDDRWEILRSVDKHRVLGGLANPVNHDAAEVAS